MTHLSCTMSRSVSRCIIICHHVFTTVSVAKRYMQQVSYYAREDNSMIHSNTPRDRRIIKQLYPTLARRKSAAARPQDNTKNNYIILSRVGRYKLCRVLITLRRTCTRIDVYVHSTVSRVEPRASRAMAMKMLPLLLLSLVCVSLLATRASGTLCPRGQQRLYYYMYN